ncbi:PepSY domain-containing protein [Roseomonas marmotae]|uniref:PepSY domain-containing protein n=1 Tax=Roseomonas marmotae TaxID=2768161 RepID=A0ABS3K7D1_9PROT|nr:PepSY domain-containing protein [Roseomonas marmotae]MBO1073376.1 PepSY domain-containing protein [Roseomonas marmotae]QTI80424.1 PepSY domain-containing protein [Roseomonas marmotae]
MKNPMAAAGLALALLAVPALVPAAYGADRRPTEAEASRISEVLRAQGYRDWRGIEMDDGLWEVDDAVAPDGTRRDVRVTPDDYAIIPRSTENRLANIEEAARIGEVLKREGFERYETAKLDDGLWKIENATRADGSRYDLTLAPETLRILHRDREG